MPFIGWIRLEASSKRDLRKLSFMYQLAPLPVPLQSRVKLEWEIDLKANSQTVRIQSLKKQFIFKECWVDTISPGSWSESWSRIPQSIWSTKTSQNCPGWCGSVGWVWACKPKGCEFDSQSQHMLGLLVRYPVGGAWEATIHWCFSPSLSSSFPPSLKINELKNKK